MRGRSFGLFCFGGCVCVLGMGAYSLTLQNQVKPVGPTYSLNLFILLWALAPLWPLFGHTDNVKPIVWWTWFCLMQADGGPSLWILSLNQEFETTVS